MGRHSLMTATVQNGEIDPVKVAEYVISVMFVDETAFVWQVLIVLKRIKAQEWIARCRTRRF